MLDSEKYQSSIWSQWVYNKIKHNDLSTWEMQTFLCIRNSAILFSHNLYWEGVRTLMMMFI